MKTKRYSWILFSAFLFSLAFSLAFSFGSLGPTARAQSPLPHPSGPVILSLSGAIVRTNAPGRADFDRAMLESIGMKTLRTSTAWTDGTQTFSGVALETLLDYVKASGKTLHAVALNDYAYDIPMAEVRKFHPLLALKQNGAYMPIRDKGPLWIVYPRDDFPELKERAYDYRWVWQLRRIDVR